MKLIAPQPDRAPSPVTSFASLTEALCWRAARTPDRVSYIFLSEGKEEPDRLNYAALNERALSISAALTRRCTPGARVLLLYPPGLDFVAAFFGCLYAGMIAVPAYPPRSPRMIPRLLAVLTDAQPEIALALSTSLPRICGWMERTAEYAALAWIATDSLEPSPTGWQPTSPEGDAVAFLQYTSGSTSTPKGVMVTHSNLVHNQRVIQEACGHSEQSVFISWLPPYHDLGLIGNLLQAAWVGAPCVLMAPVAFLQQPLRWLRAVSRYRGTTSGGPNFAYDLCVRRVPPAEIETLDLSSWQVAFNGAEPVREETLVRFAETFSPAGFRAASLYPCYGLAEATLMVSGGLPGRGPTVRELSGRRLVGCGRILPGNAAVVVDPDSGVPCPLGNVGEIWVGGGSVARGYWNSSEDTAHAFGATLPGGDEPWLRTGDLGILDGEELFVVGRLKDLIITRGRNHYPQDLEATAGNSHPALAGGTGAAFAVDGEAEEELVIVQEMDRHCTQPEEIAAAVRRAVAEEHEVLVHEVVLVPVGGVPRTTSGKVQRRLCRELYFRGELRILGASRLSPVASADDPAATPPGSLAWLCQAFATAARIDPAQVDPDHPLSALGLDSLAAVELKQTIEAGTGILLSIPELLEGMSLREAEQRIANGAPAQMARTREEAGEAIGEHLLSWNQHSLWFLHQRARESSAYNIAGAARLTGIGATSLGQVLQGLMDRHPMLRATFFETANGPIQRVAEWTEADFVHIDATGWSDEEILRRLQRESFRPFDLASGPPLRAALLERGSETFLSLAVHHIVADFWSMAVLIRELGILYAGGTLPRPGGLYLDYARRQERLLAEARGELLWEHWRERLAEARQLDLPTDRPRLPVQALRGSAQAVPPSPKRSEAVHRFAAIHGCTPFVALLTAWEALLGRWSGQEDFLLGAPTAGRSAREWADVVGYFVNPVILRADLSGDPTVSELLARAQATTLDALEHQELPFAMVTERLRPVRDPSRPALVPAMLTLQRSPLPELADLAAFSVAVPGARLALGELVLESVPLTAPDAQLDLSLMTAELPGGLALLLQWDADLFDAATTGRMLDHLDRLLAGMAQAPERRVGDIDLLSPAEMDQLAALAAVGPADYPREATVHGLLAEQARRTPDRAAVTDGDGLSTSYAEFNARANQLAEHLLAMGIAPETPVGVSLERSIEMLVALLGILKAGATYVPLDPAYPRDRLEQMMDEVAMRFLVTEERLLGSLPRSLPYTLLLDRERADIALRSKADPGGWSDPTGLAYVVFTSGSSGRPKAVGVAHRAVVRLIRGGGFADLGSDEAFLQLAPVSFDAATLEIWGPLLNGGRLVLFPRSPSVHDALGTVIAQYRVTTLWLTAGLFHEVVDSDIDALRPLRQLLAGGDVLSPAHVNRVLTELPDCTLINGYGPTENTTFTCCHRLAMSVPPGGSVPIGQPVAGTRVYVLDAGLRLVPPGVSGELFAGGDGLARGYLRRPNLTAERFIPSPFCDRDGTPGERLYRTGDRVRLRPDGALEFLGRVDGQVKIRGFRVEPGDVEAALSAHPAVTAAAVVAREMVAGGKRLEAYVVLSAPTDLRAWLKDRLPAYMVPAVVFPLPALPLNTNGKVDRQTLLRIKAEARAAGTPRAPRTPTEELLAGIWAGLLGVQVGLDDDFFALGGHSLLAGRLTVRLREALQVEVSVAALFENPTLTGFAAIVEAALGKEHGAGAAAPPIEPVPRGPRPARLPLSFAQERLWFLDRLEPGNAAYVIPLALSLQGPLTVASLVGALTAVVHRHEALRTTFAERLGRPVQEISACPALSLGLIDLAGLLPEAQQEERARHLREETGRPFDLTAGPLIRAVLLRLHRDEHLLLLSVHHIVFDGWSEGILLHELGLLYAAAETAQPAPLPPLAVQYPDFALWQRRWLDSGALAGQLAFWRQRLAGAPAALDLPPDRPRPALQTFRGAAEPVALPAELVSGLRTLARQHGASLFMTVLAGWSTVLQKAGGSPEVVVGTPVANRQRPELEGLIGLFVNTLPLRVDLTADPPFAALLDRVREAALTAYENQDVPFERLVESVATERDLARSPLFQVMLALEDGPARALRLPGMACDPVPLHNGTSKLELLLTLADAHGGLGGGLEFNTDLFDAATARRLAAQFVRLLSGAAADPQRRLGDLPLLDAAEQRQILVEWNATAAPFPHHLGLHELFEAQAARTPEATALLHGDRRLSYRELDAWADHLARRLRALGVGPEVLVGIFCGRTPALVAAALAVLKAGGAYLPLDPAYPAERLVFLVADAGVAVMLTEEGLATKLPPFAGALVLVECDSKQPCAGERPRGFLHPEQAAYAIYTSGSTGTPKGVIIRHASVVARITWALSAYAPEVLSGVLAATSLCFDLSVFEIFVPLAAGGAVVLADDALALPDLPTALAVTLVNTVPSAMSELVRAGALPRSVRVVNLAGEPLRRNLAARLYALEGVDAVYNLYGPSEDTTYSTSARVERGDMREPAIGRSLPNSRAYVLDPVLRPLPFGTPGELWLGGDGLARGYLCRPDLTADRFRPDPFGPADGGRLYSTGDLARRRADGALDYLGRLDHQVKVRGFRIELGEIEAALLAHPEVSEAAVLALTDGESPRLVACVAPAGTTAAGLRRHLVARLPVFMVPATFLSLPALPQTPNGKVDRQALADRAAGTAKERHDEHIAPRNPLEELLATLWMEVLDVERVGVHDDFFALGGHSLAGLRLVSRVRELFGVSLPVRQLFQVPTLAGLAEAVAVEMAAIAGDDLLDEISAEVAHG
jgi:amino acid adenylation domain-containing protein